MCPAASAAFICARLVANVGDNGDGLPSQRSSSFLFSLPLWIYFLSIHHTVIYLRKTSVLMPQPTPFLALFIAPRTRMHSNPMQAAAHRFTTARYPWPPPSPCTARCRSGRSALGVCWLMTIIHYDGNGDLTIVPLAEQFPCCRPVQG